MGPGRSSSLCIGGDPSTVSGSGRTGCASDRLTRVVLRNALGELSRPESRSDFIGGSEPSSGCKNIYWDSLLALSDVGISKSYNYIHISYTKVQNKTTTVVVFTVSHIQY